MINVVEYLKRIKFEEEPQCSLSTLFKLHRQHAFNVPFENLDIYHRKYIPYNVHYFYEKLVEHRRGGFCYETNGLFYELLTELGFKTWFISASLAEVKGNFGPEYDHMALIVEHEGLWLLDVGYGDSFVEPLPISEVGRVQTQNGKQYLITETEPGNYKLSQSVNGADFHDLYIFTTKARDWSEFYEMFIQHQTSPQSKFLKKRICTLPMPGGRITLGNLRLIVTQNIQRSIVQLKSEEEFFENLKQYFNIHFPIPVKV